MKDVVLQSLNSARDVCGESVGVFEGNDASIDTAGLSEFKVGSRRKGRGSRGIQIQPLEE